MSLKVAETAPLANGDDNVFVDSVGVSPLAMARGGLSYVVAGMAILAIAEAASLADFAGVASPADLAGMAFPAIAGVASPADFAGMAVPAVAGAVPLAIVEVASSTDLMDMACSSSVCSSQSAYDCLAPDDYVTMPDVVVLPDSIELGDPTVFVLPAMGAEMSDIEECHGDRDLACTEGDEHPEEQDLPRDNSEAPGFLTGWAEVTEVEFMIDTGCQVTILVTSVFERICTSDPRVRSGLGPCG